MSEKQIITIKKDERIDQLLWRDFQIIQKKKGFRFGLDAVLLADFAETAPKSRILDLCTGSGVIPLLLAAKEETVAVTGVELFPDVAEMARRSVSLNQLDRRIQILTGDICRLPVMVPKQAYQAVTVNPPYRQRNKGKLSPSPWIAAAKTELYCDLLQVAGAVAYSLAEEGYFYLVYSYERLDELLQTLQRQELQAARLVVVKNFFDSEPFLCLVKGNRQAQANNALALLKKEEFVVFREHGVYTPEMAAIFQKYPIEKKG